LLGGLHLFQRDFILRRYGDPKIEVILNEMREGFVQDGFAPNDS